MAVRLRATNGLARREQGVGRRGIEKVKRADVRPVVVHAIGHRVNMGLAVGQRGMGTGQHGAGEMCCGGHDIQPCQDSFHQRPMQVLVIAARPAVTPIDCPLRCREQGSGAASEIRNPQPFDHRPGPTSPRPADRRRVPRESKRTQAMYSRFARNLRSVMRVWNILPVRS